MKIIVSIKQVPDTSGKVAVNPDGTLNRASMQTITNPDDMNAVEAALKLKDETGCSAMDVAKGLLDHGIHPPTMYFPLIVHEALMVEPTETESQETMDEVCRVFLDLWDLAHQNPQALHDAPTKTPVRRLDEVGAARNPVLKYTPND